MNDLLDSITGQFKKYIDILQIYSPLRTAIGATAGVSLKGLSLIIAPTLRQLGDYVIFDVHSGYFVAFGIFIFNLPLLSKKNQLPEDVEKTLRSIRIGVKENLLTKTQAKGMYMTLINKIINDICLENDKSEATTDIENI